MLAILFLALAFTAGSAPPDASEPFLVRIDAVASDSRDRVVDDLRAEEFEILEDGAPRPIESVRFVTAGRGAQPAEHNTAIVSRSDEQAAAAEEGTRLFAIFLDEYHVRPGRGADRAREMLVRFVNEALGPRDLALVVKPLDSLLNLRLTRDREALIRAIEAFQARKGEYTPRNAFERELIAGTPQRIEAVRAQVATSALNALATHLAGLGTTRKAILFVSEGFGRGPRRRGDEALPSLDTAIRTASRAQVSIYPFDPNGPSAEPSADRDMLRALADETEGRVIVADADGAASLGRIAGDQTAYYLIAFRSAQIEADGRFHPVTVRVRRPNVTVTARKGYWAPSADDVLRARLLARVTEPKPSAEPPRHISPLIRPWFGLARGAGGATEVSFVWEPVGRVPGDRSRLPTPTRITLKASKPDGTAVFEGAVRPSGAAMDAVAGADDDPMKAVFETAPGRLRLQMRIEDASARVVDTDVRDLMVGPLNAPVTFGTAEIIRARNARDYRSLAGNPAAVPTPAREFSRSERLLIRVPAYAPDAPTVSARLISRAGAAMRSLSVVAGPRPNVYQIDLPLAGLASGSYVVQLAASSPAGEANDELVLRVTP